MTVRRNDKSEERLVGEELFNNLRTDGTWMTTKHLSADSELVKADVVSFPVVGIGASAGGLEAFTLLLQHLPPGHGHGVRRGPAS